MTYVSFRKIISHNVQQGTAHRPFPTVLSCIGGAVAGNVGIGPYNDGRTDFNL